MNKKMIPIAVVLATAALLAMVTTTPLAFAQDGDRMSDGDRRSDGDYKKSDGGDQESETNEKLKAEGDCNFSGKGNTCLQVPINIEAVGDVGL